MDLLAIAIPLAVVLLSLTVHEAAHAWTADRLGDPTARMLGRVSLNPVVHVDPIGTLLLPVLAAASHLPIIGWAKPVPVNTARLGNPRRDFVLVAAAGPVSNLLQAFVAAMALRVVMTAGATEAAGLVPHVLFLAVQINLLLAFFNLVPVPPLDGGNVLAGLLPPRAGYAFARLRPYGFLLLYALMFTGVLSALIAPPTDLFLRLLLP